MIEVIKHKGKEVAIIAYKDSFDQKVTFITPEDYPMQFAVMKYEKGDSADAHTHPDIPRVITQSQEAIHIVEGKIRLNIFDSKGEFHASRILERGDSAFFVRGGRGWTALEKTKLVEVKQGPYLGERDKVLF